MISAPSGSTPQIEWNQWLIELPNPHLMQSWHWGDFKSRHGWVSRSYTWQQCDGRIIPVSAAEGLKSGHTVVAAAQILLRRVSLPGGLISVGVAYVPKGPILNWKDETTFHQVLADLQTFAKQLGAIFLKIDPDILVGTGLPGETETSEDAHGQNMQEFFRRSGWIYSQDQIQFRNTFLLDLSPSEEELLAQMKQKTRYNIRLAERKGVVVRPVAREEFPVLFRMYAETSVRDGFVIREADYYLDLWSSFHKDALLAPFLAEYDGDLLAAIVIFRFGETAYYMHGMSRDVHRNLMPNYLLQWKAIQWAKSNGCTIYDFWGAPDVFEETDPMWGVYKFKQGLGGVVHRYIGAWDYPLRPFLYRLYTGFLPKMLNLMRHRGRTRTRNIVES